MGRKGAKVAPDQVIGRSAARQHGVVTTAQLLGAGLHSSGVTKRVAGGRLHRIHRGVYAVGHPRLSNEGRWMAAVLACGEGAVLSHRSASELWGMLRPRVDHASDAGASGSDPLVDVTVPGAAGRKKRRGVALHRSSSLSAADCTRRAGIPVTTPARTLTDLRRSVSGQLFAAALREAEYLRLAVESIPQRDRTRSELEARFLALVRRHRLPRPEVNVRVDRFTVDFLWRSQRLIVELDGWESHGTRSAFETDRARDARLKLLGFDVLRLTWRQIERDRAAVAATIRSVLGQAA